MEDEKKAKETEAKKEALEKKKTAHRRLSGARRLLKIGTIAAIGLVANPSQAEAQGSRLERINRTQQVEYGTPAWAESQGYVYSARYSQGINRRGMINMETGTWEHHGYLGAWIKPTNQPGVMKVLFLPKNPVADADRVEEQYSTTAKDMMKRRDGPYIRSNVSPLGRILPRGWSLE